MLGLIERIVEMYHKRKMSLVDISAALAEEGITLSKSAIHRTLRTAHEGDAAAANAYRVALAEARAMLDLVQGEPNTDVLEVVTSFLATKLLKNVKDIESLDFDDPQRLIDAVYRLTRAQVATGRLRMEFEKGFTAARARILDALAADLGADPELLERVRALVGRVQPEG